MDAFIAITPLALVFLLLVLWQWPAKHAMPIGLFVTVIIAVFYWQVSPARILAAGIEGLIISANVLYIIIGALFLLFTLVHSGAVSTIRDTFARISPDPGIQAIIIAWTFGAFINIVAASATCGLSGQEGNLIRKTIIPALYYLFIAGVMGCLLVFL